MSISLGRPLQPSRLREALNALLPSDISVSSAKAVPASFNARYAAIAKTYEYRIWNKPYRSVWNQGYSWHIIRPLDLASMRKATSCLLGKCDFSAFDGAGGTQPNKNVNMRRIRISRTAGMVKVVLTADRFLHKMVRNIAGTLVEVGLGRRAPESLRTVLSGRKRVAAGRTAPAQGLFLTTVHYKKG